MEGSRPSQGTQLAGIGGLALILVMFLFAWYGVKGAGVSQGFDAFDTFRDWVNLILVFAAFSGMALAITSGRVNLPFSLSAATAGLGGVSVILIIIYLISPPGVPFGGDAAGLELGRKVGAWFGLISAALLTYGGWQARQGEERTSVVTPEDREERRSRRQAEPPPPPPADEAGTF